MDKLKVKRKKPKVTLSAVIIARNEEEKIGDCLHSVKWADEVIVIDNDSSDKTVEIAKKAGATVIEVDSGYNLKYSKSRNLGLKKAKGDWIFYIDADERATPQLKQEILKIVQDSSVEYPAYAIPRKNIILGKEMKHGGWWPDYVKRLFLKKNLKRWKGDLHEEPVYEGKMGHLKNPLIHIKHNKLEEMVEKTNKWSEIEARNLFESGHPKMTWWRFFRIMFTELWLRLIKNRGFLDGVEGVVYSIYQMWSKFITYGKLWEMQIKSESRQNTSSVA